MIERDLAPFGGLVTSVDAALLAKGSPAQQNCEVEDGAIGWRLGYRSVIPAPTNCTGVRCFQYFSTYTSAGVFKDGFIAVLIVSGHQLLYEISLNASTDVWEYHEILYSAASLDLPATFTRIVAFRDTVYIFNRDSAETGADPGPLLQYTPGSYVATAVKRPTAPTGVVSVNYAKNSGGGAAYNKVRWTGLDVATEVAYTSPAQATSSSLTGETFIIAHAAATSGKGKVKIDLSAISAGSQDLQRSDVLAFTLTLPVDTTVFQIVSSSIKFYAENATGTETELKVTAVPFTNSAGGIIRIECYAEFQDKTRATWATTKYFSLEYDVSVSSGTAANNLLRFDPVLKGGMKDWYGDNVDAPADAAISVQYSWGNTTTGYESGLSSGVTLSRAQLLGSKWEFTSGLYLGSMPILNTAASAETNVDRVRIYMSRSKKATGTGFGKSRRLVDQADTDTTYDLATMAADFENLTEYDPSPFRHDDIVCGCVVGQYVAWGYQGGEQNIRLSRVGQALLQADADDVLTTEGNSDDLARGATFSLTDDHTDAPKGLVPCGTVLVILGNDGIYAMVDTGQGPTKGIPSSMSPPRRVPGAPGTIGYESFWKGADKYGNPGVFYITQDTGAVKFIQVFENFDGKSGFRIVDVSEDVHGAAFSTYLYGGSRLIDPEVAMCYVDPVTDSVCAFYSTRRLRLLRPSRAPGKEGLREWAFADFEPGQWAGTWQKVTQAGQRGVFGLRTNGTMDEFDRANVKQSGSSSRVIVPLDASAFTPSSTNTGTERVVFASPPGWTDGWGVTFSASGGGFTAGTTYYARRIDGFTYEFYDTRAHAVNTGATTGRVNITASITASIRPIGQDDGSVPPACYWDSPNYIGPRRRAFRVKVERESLTDVPSVRATADRASQTSTLASGEKYVRFGHTVSGEKVQYRVTLPVLSGKVQQLRVEEAVIGGGKQR